MTVIAKQRVNFIVCLNSNVINHTLQGHIKNTKMLSDLL